MGKISEHDTKTLILDAAEQSFADLGFDAASLRHIISVAGVNLAAVHYHFGSKEGLIRAVFDRRLGPLNEERLRALDEIEAAAGRRKGLPLEPVIRALIEPALRLARDPLKGGPDVMRLFGRTIAEPSPELQLMLHGQFGHVASRFGAALKRACPGLPPSVLQWRFHFTIGAMGHVMCDPTKMREFTGGACDPADTEEVIRQMTGFLAAGFRAPVEKPARRKRAAAAKLLVIGFLGVAASACSSVRPDTALEVPERWQTAASGEAPTREWWRGFGDTNLTRLVEEALVANRDLAAMRARVEAAREQSRVVGSARLPTVDAQLSGSRQQQVFVGLPIPGATGPLQTRASVRTFNLVANWELDLWGRVNSGRKAALADYLAATDDLRGARLSLAAQIARSWVRLVEVEGQLEIARGIAASHAAEVRVARARYVSGLRSSQTLRVAESGEATARASLAAREVELADVRRQLEVLLGRYPSGELEARTGLPALLAEVPAGLPSELLERRPDLLAARWRLEGAGLRVKEAKAGLLPRLSLTASGGRSSNELQDLLDHDFSIWTVAANVAQPVFQGGRLRANVRQSEARLRKATANYDATALEAFKEVEAALQNESSLAAQEREMAAARDQAAALANVANERQRLGLDEVGAALTAERSGLEARSRWLSARRARLENRIALYLALGGGFELPGTDEE